ncbi:MAG TPA: putative collagen-binding domain-containing protein, partial [Cyclobacteriaceae bacterium]
KPGDTYVLYLRYGGYVKVNLGDSELGYSYFWLNPSTGEKTPTRSDKGRGYVSFMSPGSYPAETEVKDWVLYIKVGN